MQQLSVEQDPERVRIDRARRLYYQLHDHGHCYDKDRQDQMVREIRQLSPWWGMLAHRYLAKRRRDAQNWRTTPRIRHPNNKLLLEKTLGGCAPIKDWPPECRTKKKPRGWNWPEKPARTTQSVQDGPKPPEA